MKLRLLVLLLLAGSAAAQRPVFEPDDFIDPSMHGGSLFLSRIVAGGVWNQSDRFRPVGGDAGLVVLTNSLYTGKFQFEYEHTEFVGREECFETDDGVQFPCDPQSRRTLETGPAAQRGDTLQVGFYAPGERTLRYRVSWSRQTIETMAYSPDNQAFVTRSGRDQSFTLDADTYIPLGNRGLYGTLYVARSTRSGITDIDDDDTQTEIAYVFRPPGFSAGPFLFRTKLAVGGISGREASGVNLINPYFETYWRHGRTKVNFHVVWSGEWTRGGVSGVEGWRANHQVAVFLDRTLFVKMFGR